MDSIHNVDARPRCLCGALRSERWPYCLDCYLSMPLEVRMALRCGGRAQADEWLAARIERDRAWLAARRGER